MKMGSILFYKRVEMFRLNFISFFVLCCIYLPSMAQKDSLVEKSSLPLYDSFSAWITNDSVPLKQYKKIELAIDLPPFLRDEVERFVLSDGEEGINPYLEWELSVKVILQHKETQEIDTIDAFYFQNLVAFDYFDSLHLPKNGIGFSVNEYRQLGEWKRKETPYSFLARFVAMQAGEWNYRVIVSTKNQQFQTPIYDFFVEENPQNPFISLSSHRRYLYKDKKVFHPVGGNVLWPQTIVEIDSVFAYQNKYKHPSGEIKLITEEFRNVYAAPRVYEMYRKHLLEFHQAGANWMRIIQMPHATEIEFEKLGNYTDRLHMATELDKLVELAEDNDFYIQWCMAIHNTFNIKPYGISHWDWDDTEGENIYAYKKAFHLKSPIDFFKNEEAKKYYQQRIRYILARWGYSGNIGLFEVLSEVDNTAESKDKSRDLYPDVYSYIESWQNEMARYVKRNYFGKIHLLAGSYAGLKPEKDQGYFENDAFDVMGSNIYQYRMQASSDFWLVEIGKNVLNQSKDANEQNYLIQKKDGVDEYKFKPLALSESEPITMRHTYPKSQVELYRHIWQSKFSGVAYDLPWTLWMTKRDFHVLREQQKFNQLYGIKDDNWHPWYMEIEPYQGNNLWKLNPQALKQRQRDLKSKADIIYLRSNTLDKALGVITNKTVNYRSLEGYEGDDVKYKTPEIVDLKRLQIIGMNTGDYRVYYYLPNDLDHPVYVQHAKAKRGKIRLNYVNLRDTLDTFILLFRVVPDFMTIPSLDF